MLTHCHCNECSIIAVCCVKVASTGASSEYSNGFMIFDWEIAEEAYEAKLVINLIKDELLPIRGCICITFNSGLADMVAVVVSLQLFCVHQQELSDQDDQLSQYEVCQEELMPSMVI